MPQFITEKEIFENRERFGGGAVTGEDEHYDPRPLFEKMREKRELEEEQLRDRLRPKPPKALDAEEYEFLQDQEEAQTRKEQRILSEDEELLRTFHKEQNRLSQASQAAISLPTPTATPTSIDITTSIISHRPRVPTKLLGKKKRELLPSLRAIHKTDHSAPSTPPKTDPGSKQPIPFPQQSPVHPCTTAIPPSHDEGSSEALLGLLGAYSD